MRVRKSPYFRVPTRTYKIFVKCPFRNVFVEYAKAELESGAYRMIKSILKEGKYKECRLDGDIYSRTTMKEHTIKGLFTDGTSEVYAVCYNEHRAEKMKEEAEATGLYIGVEIEV